jgi:hypothetical protein
MAKSSTRTASPKQAKPAATTAPAVRFALTIGRPQQGGNLFAHTVAFLELAGMLDTQACAPIGAFPRATAAKVIGETAVGYHQRKGTMERTDQGLVLSPEGAMHFAARGATNIELIDEFKALLSTGKVGVKVAAILPKGYKVSPL